MRTEAPASTRPTPSSASACPVMKVTAVRKVRTPRLCERITNQRKDANEYSVDVGMCSCGTDSSGAAFHAQPQRKLVRILSHLILTTQPPAALVELILIGMQLFFFTTFITSVSACCSQTVCNGTD